MQIKFLWKRNYRLLKQIYSFELYAQQNTLLQQRNKYCYRYFVEYVELFKIDPSVYILV